MPLLGLSLLLLLAESAWGQTTYNYNRCDLVNGPYAWPAPCTPLQQDGTPIDLCNGKPFPSTFSKTISVTGYNVPRTMNIFNPGLTIQINVVGNAPTLQIANLSNIVGRGVAGASPNINWTLGQMHLHWGRLNRTDEGSEHYMQGVPYVAEAHFVHYNPTRGNSVGEAVASKASDALLVVGVFYQLGATDANTMTVLVQNTANATKTPTPLGQQVTLSDMFDGTGEYYSYAGGLTTPTCNPQVTWIVMKTPKTITLALLNQLKTTAVTNPPAAPASRKAAGKFDTQAITDLQAFYGNYRPLQFHFFRTIYSSDGTTAACTIPALPNFGCNAAFLVSPSILTPLAILVSLFLMSRE